VGREGAAVSDQDIEAKFEAMAVQSMGVQLALLDAIEWQRKLLAQLTVEGPDLADESTACALSIASLSAELRMVQGGRNG
jgi:hypothetical protein